MPWHIILVFFALGILMGINSGKKQLTSRHKKAQQ